MPLLLVIVRRVYEQLGIELQDPVEKAVVERGRISGRKIGPASAADQQRIARQHAVGKLQAHRIAGMSWRVQHAQSQISDQQHLAIVDAHVHERRATLAMHDHRDLEPSREFLRRREMVRMGVRVDQEMNPQPVPRREREVAIDLRDLRVDQRARAAGIAPDEVRLASTGGNLLEDHDGATRRV